MVKPAVYYQPRPYTRAKRYGQNIALRSAQFQHIRPPGRHVGVIFHKTFQTGHFPYRRGDFQRAPAQVGRKAQQAFFRIHVPGYPHSDRKKFFPINAFERRQYPAQAAHERGRAGALLRAEPFLTQKRPFFIHYRKFCIGAADIYSNAEHMSSSM